MQINWKKVAASPGYKSLKAACIKNIKEDQDIALRHGGSPFRSKAELRRLFVWVIGRATHYAYKQDRPIEDILWAWESDRGNQWWFGYYSNHKQPKLLTYTSRYRACNSKLRSKKKPVKWPAAYKKTMARQARYKRSL
ncbi:MAG: hypothetical protein DRH90_12485 [Deltaproteobacteria bacterium]|nr:MAG: hypothetical protein DRH90_12485 [Deltaproteobacteria bacterium]